MVVGSPFSSIKVAIRNAWMKAKELFYSLKPFPVRELLLWSVLGFALRFILAPFTSQPFDTVVWYNTVLDTVYGSAPYERYGFSYPPVWAYILELFGLIGSKFSDPASFGKVLSPLSELHATTGMASETVTSPWFNLLAKTPLFIFDFLLAYLLFLIVFQATKNRSSAKTAFIFWFLNPLVVFTSAVVGQFDVLSAFLAVLAAALILERKVLLSGFVWVLGAAAKIMPLYLGPLFLFISISAGLREKSSGRLRGVVKRILIFGGGALIASTIILLPVIVAGTLPSLLRSILLARLEGGVVVGGFSMWAIRYSLRYEWVFSWAYAHPKEVIGLMNLVMAVIAVILGVVALWWGGKAPLKTVVLGSLATISVLCLVNPLTNPQQLLWLLPWLILAKEIYKAPLALFSIIAITLGGFAFYMFLQGPFIVLFPLSAFTNVVNPDSLAQLTINYWRWKGFIHATLKEDLLLFSTMIGLIGILAGLYSAIGSLWGIWRKQNKEEV